MTAFIVFAGLLVAGALLLILPPLLGYGRRNQAQVRQSAMVLNVLREQLAELDAELAEGKIDAATHAKTARSSSAARSKRARRLPKRLSLPTCARAAAGRWRWP